MEQRATGRRRGFMEAFGHINDQHAWILDNSGPPRIMAGPEDPDEGL